MTKTLLVRQIVPFTGQGAQTRDIAVGRFPDQEVRQIVESMRALPRCRKMILQPQHFRQFHFDADFAANIAQGGILRGVNAFGLVCRAMIHPHDDVMVRRFTG